MGRSGFLSLKNQLTAVMIANSASAQMCAATENRNKNAHRAGSHIISITPRHAPSQIRTVGAFPGSSQRTIARAQPTYTAK